MLQPLQTRDDAGANLCRSNKQLSDLTVCTFRSQVSVEEQYCESIDVAVPSVKAFLQGVSGCRAPLARRFTLRQRFSYFYVF